MFSGLELFAARKILIVVVIMIDILFWNYAASCLHSLGESCF